MVNFIEVSKHGKLPEKKINAQIDMQIEKQHPD